jgi:hypothetical protein
MTDEELLRAACDVLPIEWGMCVDGDTLTSDGDSAYPEWYMSLHREYKPIYYGNLILRILELIEDRLGLSAMLVFRENTIHLCAPGAKPMIWNTCKGQTIQHAVLEALLWASKQEGWSK